MAVFWYDENMKKNKFIYFLGSGSECNYQEPRRKNASLFLCLPKGNIIIDVGDAFPDNWNLLKKKKKFLRFPSALFLTHSHLEHIYSFERFKYYALRESVKFQTFTTRETLKEIKKTFYWLKNDDFNKITFLEYGKKFTCLGEKFIPFKLKHGKIDTTGFRLGDTVCLPDFDGSIPKNSLPIIQGSKTIIMECNNVENKMKGHNNLENAIKLGRLFNKKWKMQNLILTHMGDEFPVKRKECNRFIARKYPNESFKIIPSFDLMKI